MAHTPEQIDEYRRKHGLDPARWDYNSEENRFYERSATPEKRPIVRTAQAEQVEAPEKARGVLGKTWDALNYSIGPDFPRVEREETDGITEGLGKGIYNTLADVGNSVKTPLGIALAPFFSAKVAGMLPKIAQRVVANPAARFVVGGGTMGMMGANTLQQAGRLVEAKDAQERTEALLGGTVGALGTYGGLKIMKSPRKIAPVVADPNAPIKTNIDPALSSELKQDYSRKDAIKLSPEEAAEALRGTRTQLVPAANTEGPFLKPLSDPMVEAQQAITQERNALAGDIKGQRLAGSKAKATLAEQAQELKVYNIARNRLIKEAGFDPKKFDLDLSEAASAADKQITQILDEAGLNPRELELTAESTLGAEDPVMGLPTGSLKKPLVDTSRYAGPEKPPQYPLDPLSNQNIPIKPSGINLIDENPQRVSTYPAEGMGEGVLPLAERKVPLLDPITGNSKLIGDVRRINTGANLRLPEIEAARAKALLSGIAPTELAPKKPLIPVAPEPIVEVVAPVVEVPKVIKAPKAPKAPKVVKQPLVSSAMPEKIVAEPSELNTFDKVELESRAQSAATTIDEIRTGKVSASNDLHAVDKIRLAKDITSNELEMIKGLENLSKSAKLSIKDPSILTHDPVAKFFQLNPELYAHTQRLASLLDEARMEASLTSRVKAPAPAPAPAPAIVKGTIAPADPALILAKKLRTDFTSNKLSEPNYIANVRKGMEYLRQKGSESLAHAEQYLTSALDLQKHTNSELIKGNTDSAGVKAAQEVVNHAMDLVDRAEAIKARGGLKVTVNPKAGEAGMVDMRLISESLKRSLDAVKQQLKDSDITGALRAGHVPFIESRVQGLSRSVMNGAKQIAGRLNELGGQRRAIVGQFRNEFATVSKSIPKIADAHKVIEAMLNDKDTQSRTAFRTLSPELQAAYQGYSAVLKRMAEHQIASGQPVWNGREWRSRGVDPYYAPEIVSRQVLRDVQESKGNWEMLKEDFIDHRMRKLGVDRAEAENLYDEYLGGVDKYGGLDFENQVKFGAVRKAEGIGLPKSWRETNPNHLFDRYANKFGRDRAFYDVMEKNPDAMHMLGLRQDIYGNPVVPKTPHLGNFAGNPYLKSAMNEYMGNMGDIEHAGIRAATKLFKTSILGIVLKTGDMLSVVPAMVKFLPDPVRNLPGMLAHLKEADVLKSALANSIKNGFNQVEVGAQQLGGSFLDKVSAHTETMSEAITDLSRLQNKVTSQHALETYSRVLAQATGEYAVNLHRELALVGDPVGIKFMERLSDQWQTLTPDELGTRVAELVQGTYDFRNLPNAPGIMKFFMSLSKWGIEQSNHAMEFLVKPVMEGNASPLVATVGTALVFGMAREAINSNVFGRQSTTPTQDEINSATPEMQAKLQGYRAMALMETMGVGGIVMSLTKGVVDEALMKMDARGLKNPEIEALADFAKKSVALVSALYEGEDPLEAVGQYFTDNMAATMGTVRAVQSAALKLGEVESPGMNQADVDRRMDFRNRRMHSITQGLKVNALRKPQPDYSGLSVKKFKRTSDTEEAKRLLPIVLDRAKRRGEGNPERLKEELSSLRRNPIQSFPNPDEDEGKAQRYYIWLQKTKGPVAAKAALDRYMKLKNLNELKREAIPVMD